MKQMKISEALPEVFTRAYTMIEPHTHMLLALSILRFQNLDALPIGVWKSRSRKIAVSGFSCLSEVMSLGPGDYERFLNEPCESYSVKLATIHAEDDLEDLLRTFSETGFGFACVDGRGNHDLRAFVGLRDLVGLCTKSVITADLSAGDVASSPIFSLPRDATLKQALEEMIERGKRRVFLDETDLAVSDRSIINHIFSASKLSEASSKSYDLLAITLGEIEHARPEYIDEGADLKKAAEQIIAAKDHCLICEKGVITPWDLVMKPWEQHRLTLSA